MSSFDNVFQVYITESPDIPEKIKRCMQTVQSNKGSNEYKLFAFSAGRDFIERHFPPDVLWAYDRLIPFAYKADLVRYCLLYTFGGWYFDSAMRLRDPLPNVRGVEMIVFRDAPNPMTAGNWNVSNGVFYSQPGTKVLELAINHVVQHCKEEFYGSTSLDPTGPGLFGRSLAMVGPNRGVMTGMYLALTPMHRNKNYAYVLPDGRILAYGKETAGTPDGLGLAAFGDTGTNSYEDLYRQRKIYHPRGDSTV